MEKLKEPKIIIILILLSIILIGGLFSKNKINEINNQYKVEKHYIDSTYKVDSLAMVLKYSSLDSQYSSILLKKDSLSYKDSINSHTSKILTRIIYKDSIKEVYIENNDYIATSQKIIISLQDSINSVKKESFEKDLTINQLEKNLALTKKDSSSSTIIHEKTITPIDKKFSLFGNISTTSTQNIDLSFGAELGAEYKILAPIYIGASIQKTNLSTTSGYKANIKVGAKLDF